jgi:hypothetical protein
MLANSFMKAEALGITEPEVRAMIKVLGMLERGELQHVPNAPRSRRPITNGFCMDTWECGTAACIGGWVQRVSGISMEGRWREFPAIDHLFYPEEMNDDALLSKMTDGAAAIALRNYLTTGEPRWAEALAE